MALRGRQRFRVRLQFRADAFNAFNRTNFAVNGTVGNPNFGRATSPQDGPRLITMGLAALFLIEQELCCLVTSVRYFRGAPRTHLDARSPNKILWIHYLNEGRLAGVY